MKNRDPWTWLGLAVVGVTALVWSFTALSDLAHRCGVTAVIEIGDVRAEVSWGLPITVDVLALVATRVWLRGDAPAEAVRYARRAAWSAIVATVVGNGYHGLLVGSFAFDALIVSAAPAVVIGVIVHLAVLVGRSTTEEPADEQPSVSEKKDTDAATAPEPPPMARPVLRIAPAQVTSPTVSAAVADEEPVAKARRLAASGIGRTRIIRETGLKDHVAKAIVAEAKARA